MTYSRSLILLLVITWISFSDSNGQILSGTSLNVSATVQASDIEIVTMQSIDLLNAEIVNGIVTIDPVLSARAGKMMALGSPNTLFRINFDSVRELNNITAQGLIFVEYAISGNVIDEQDSSELFEEEGRELQFNEDGTYFFWIGGRIDLSQATPGTYEGEFTLEIEYL